MPTQEIADPDDTALLKMGPVDGGVRFSIDDTKSGRELAYVVLKRNRAEFVDKELTKILRLLPDKIIEDLGYSIEHFSEGGDLIEVLGRLHDLDAARAAYRECRAKYPKKLIMLCQVGRTLQRSDRPNDHASGAKEARHKFRSSPSNAAAADYLDLAERFAAAELSDVTVEVTHWLRTGRLLILPDVPR